MYHIKRVGEVAYKLTDLRRATISRGARGGYPNQDWEDHEDATQLKDTVEANGVISLDIGYMKKLDQNDRADPESPPNRNRAEMTGDSNADSMNGTESSASSSEAATEKETEKSTEVSTEKKTETSKKDNKSEKDSKMVDENGDGIIGGVEDAGEDIINGAGDAAEDIIDGVTGDNNNEKTTATGR